MSLINRGLVCWNNEGKMPIYLHSCIIRVDSKKIELNVLKKAVFVKILAIKTLF